MESPSIIERPHIILFGILETYLAHFKKKEGISHFRVFSFILKCNFFLG